MDGAEVSIIRDVSGSLQQAEAVLVSWTRCMLGSAGVYSREGRNSRTKVDSPPLCLALPLTRLGATRTDIYFLPSLKATLSAIPLSL